MDLLVRSKLRASCLCAW